MRGQRVPVVRGGHEDRVDVLVVEDAAQVLPVPGLKVGHVGQGLGSFDRGSANRLASMSHSVLISTFLSVAKPRLSELPWPRMPMLATTTRSLAPRTRLPTAITAAAATAVRDANSRRETSFRSSVMMTSCLFASKFRPNRGPGASASGAGRGEGPLTDPPRPDDKSDDAENQRAEPEKNDQRLGGGEKEDPADERQEAGQRIEPHPVRPRHLGRPRAEAASRRRSGP